MALEAGTYIDDLVSSNPVGASDFVSNGDDHLRLIKAVLKNTFPNATKAFYLPASPALKSANYTVLTTDQNQVIPVSCETAARTVTLPANAGLSDGFQVTIVKADYSPNVLTIDGNSSDTINGALTVALYQKYQSAKLTWCSTLAGWIAEINEQTPIGFIQACLTSVLPAGWLWLNGTTIGNASSAATGRANADCLGLFTILWDALSDTNAPVSGGRGATAALDFAANKRLTLPNFAGYVPAGRDEMNGVAAVSKLTSTYFGSSGSTLGNANGAESKTIAQANIPSYTLPDTLTATTSVNLGNETLVHRGGTATDLGGGSGSGFNNTTRVTITASATTTINGSVTSGGSGTPLSIVQPTYITNYMIKL